MWNEKSFFSRIETGYGFTKDMNIELVERFNTSIFNQGSAILKIKFFIPKNLIVQHLVEEKVHKIQVNRKRNIYIVDVLTSIDVQEIVKIGDKYLKYMKVLFSVKILKYLILGNLLINC